MESVIILNGARTPFGTFGGSLREVTPVDLGVAAASGAIVRAGVEPGDVDSAFIGNVLQSQPNAPFLARHVALKAGLRIASTALTLNRLCGSGMQAVVSAAQAIRLGESELALAGGTENMSMSPFAIWSRWGVPLGHGQLYDTLWGGLADDYCGLGMALTAENLAEQYQIAREEQDRFAHLSQMRAADARSAGRLAAEIVPVTVPGPRGKSRSVEQDEHIRPQTTVEELTRLTPRFKPGGTVTAGNASGINDGAAALVLASESRAARAGRAPLGRILSWGIAGVDPAYMGIGPAPAARQALRRAGLSLEQMDLLEINEAFAAQYLAVEKELGLDRERTNVNGGAVALGHPVGASGARLLISLLLELRRRGGRYGLAALCIGGGQGIAMVVEAFSAA